MKLVHRLWALLHLLESWPHFSCFWPKCIILDITTAPIFRRADRKVHKMGSIIPLVSSITTALYYWSGRFVIVHHSLDIQVIYVLYSSRRVDHFISIGIYILANSRRRKGLGLIHDIFSLISGTPPSACRFPAKLSALVFLCVLST